MDLYIDHIKNQLKKTEKINLSEVTITDKDLEIINKRAKKDKDLFCIEKE